MSLEAEYNADPIFDGEHFVLDFVSSWEEGDEIVTEKRYVNGDLTKVKKFQTRVPKPKKVVDEAEVEGAAKGKAKGKPKKERRGLFGGKKKPK